MKKYIGPILVGIFVILFIFEFVYNLNELDYVSTVGIEVILKYTAFIFISVLSRYWYLLLGWLIFKIADVRFKKDKLSKEDYQKQDKEYYRNILKGYDIAELSYIDDFSLDYPKDVVTVLLNLQNKGKIKFDEVNKKIIVSDADITLSDGESIVLDAITDGKLCNLNITNFKNAVKNSAFNKGLLKKGILNPNRKKSWPIFLTILVLAFITVIIILTVDKGKRIDEFYIVGIIIIIFVLFMIWRSVFIGTFMLRAYKHLNNPFIRSKIGEEINKNLEGLKIFLKDFSNLESKNAQELAIWDEYLIYSVLFNQNQKVVDEISQNYFY